LKIFFILVALLLGFASPASAKPPKRPDHVVIVIEENRSFKQIMDSSREGSYIHSLIKRGLLFTQSYAVSHPSQPNYLALFSGTTHNVYDDGCQYQFDTENLASSLTNKGLSFATYSESLPATGDRRCMYDGYQRKHNPIVNWPRLPAEMNRRFSDFSQDFSQLPTVSFIIPDQYNDMHDGSFKTADEWLKQNIAPYVEWADTHNSLLIVTWDEDDSLSNNHIATFLVGPMVKNGTSSQLINHYTLLRLILDLYDLPRFGLSADSSAIEDIWKKK
jgi:acid phosphatase